ncbi:MAG: thiamine pyrophosphate-dependent enzyme [Prolixibacteraceae bacterium]|jgi:2-oxoglutarate ferredoxin oxidoreductase subunit beta|nr:thiamine pyrophosphate-dependent enzyme [Prolixibacteraceae bacterium]
MDLKDIIKPENLVYEKPKLLTDNTMHYCPGCSHGVAHKLIAEVVEILGIQDKTIAVAPVGCSVFAYNYIHVDWQEAAHGRAPAVATGISRTNPDKVVFTYQGDGDLASIGTAEIMHACNRGENFVVIFINNGIYGMTGGQMAPTTLLGQVTSTTPCGRDAERNGYPLKITELIAQLPGTSYVTRQSVHTPAAIRKCRKAITKAFEAVMAKKGTSFVEVVSTCNMNWKMTPVQANEWMEENMFKFYPPGDLKDGSKADPESFNKN